MITTTGLHIYQVSVFNRENPYIVPGIIHLNQYLVRRINVKTSRVHGGNPYNLHLAGTAAAPGIGIHSYIAGKPTGRRLTADADSFVLKH